MKATLHEKKLILFGPDRLTNGKPIAELKSVIVAAVENNYLDIVIDLSRTQYIDSSGIGELVASFTTLRNRGGSLCLNRLTPKARDFLLMTKLLNVLISFDVDYSSHRIVDIDGNNLSELKKLQS
jgi:anti-sigma B factor antagonist